MRYVPLVVAACLAPLGAQACTLSFTSPIDGATVRTAGITVFGMGGADANLGDSGTVTATLNGAPFFNYSGSFTAAVSFLQSRGVPVTLRRGQNFLFVSGSVGGCSASDAMTITFDPEITQSKNKGEPDNPSCQSNAVNPAVGNPINAAVGNKFQREIDYQNATASHLRFERTYNSFDGYWRHTYSARLAITANEIRLIRADGREIPFTLASNVATPATDELGNLQLSSGTWTYSSPDQEILRFDTQGRLTSWRTSDGREVALSHSGTTVTVTADTGQTLSFSQDTKYQPLQVSAGGETIQYTYDSLRRMTKMTRSLGGSSSERAFLYENTKYPRLLTGIIDERGIRNATWTYDDYGRATSSTHDGGADKTLITYNADGSATVTNELGKKTIYRYQVIQGVKKVVAIQGEPSANCPASNSSYAYNTRGLMTSKTDNKGVVTTYTYNTRGLEATRTEASGTPQARTIQTTWHPTLFLPVEVTEPDRITTYTYDAQGRLLSSVVTPR